MSSNLIDIAAALDVLLTAEPASLRKVLQARNGWGNRGAELIFKPGKKPVLTQVVEWPGGWGA